MTPISKNSVWVRISLATALLLLVCSGIARPQNTATADLKGVIYDPSGAVIQGASLQLTNLANKVTTSTTSTETGEYFFRFLPPGRYQLTVKKQGFATTTVPEVVLQVSINVEVPITLKPGRVEQTITVSESAAAVNTIEATLTRAVTNDQVRGLPIISTPTGRTVLNVLPFLLPGVTPTDPAGGADGQGFYMSINGNRRSSIAFNFEGGDNNDPEWNRAASPMPNPDALQEFTIVSNSYKAELGRSGGGVVNATTRSGTDEYHGNLRYYLSNEALDARGFFDTVTPRNRLNTFGGQLGGPVRIPKLYNGKGRTQFMFDYEETRSQSSSLYTGVGAGVLLPSERNGDFSYLINPALAAPGGVCDPNRADYVRVCTYPRNPLGPRDTTGALTGTRGKPITFFTNGQVATSLFNPISKYYLDHFIPQPNDPTGGRLLVGQYMPFKLGDRQFTIKIDHKFSNSDSISGTYFQTKSKTLTTSTTNLPLNSHQDSLKNNYNLIVRETHVFSPKLVNQFSATATRYWDGFIFSSPGVTGVAPSEIGFTGIRPQTSGVNLGLPNLLITGSGIQITSGNSNYSAKTSWQVKDDLSWTRGKHDLKFGYEMRGYQFNKALANNNGSFGFNGANVYGSGNSIIDFLLGVPNAFSQSTGTLLYPRNMAYSFYAQDDWRVRPTLTLNLGLRYELSPSVHDKMGQINAFRPGVQSTRIPTAPLGMIFAGDADPILGTLPDSGYPTDKNNFAPRLGFAWAPRPETGWLRSITGDGKTSIRGGFGVFFDLPYSFTFTQASFSPPYSVSYSADAATIFQNGGTYANPYGTATNPFPWTLENRNFVTPVTFYPFDPNFRTGYIYQYSLTVQRELPWKMLAEVAYVGSNSFKLEKQIQLNPALLVPGATTANVTQRRIYYCRTVQFPTTCPVADRLFSNIMEHISAGRANYNSLQARVVRKFAAGLSFDVSYTFAKALDDGTEPQIAQLGGISNQNAWARSKTDRRHQITSSYTWDLPRLRVGRLDRLVNGWRIGGITSWRSGTPLDIVQTTDTSLAGLLNNPRGIPDLVGPWQTFDNRTQQTLTIPGPTPGTFYTVTGYFFYNPNAFALVPTPTDYTQARVGNLPRNLFSGPNLFTTDISLIKQIKVTERQQFELRADITNVFNHPQLFYPGSTIGTTSAGNHSIYSAIYGRRIQVTGRYTF